MKLSPRTMVALRVGALILVLAPVLLTPSTSFAADSTLVTAATVPSVLAATVSSRAAVVTPVLSALAAELAYLADAPLVAALFMCCVAAAVGLAAARGWNQIGANIGIWTSAIVIRQPPAEWAGHLYAHDDHGPVALVAAVIVLAVGWWVALWARLAVRGLKLPPPPLVPGWLARYFGVTLAILIGFSTYAALRWIHTGQAFWIVMTLFVVMRPALTLTRRRIASRVVGTFAGALLCGLIVFLVGRHLAVISLLAVVAIALAVWANFTKPYWVYSIFLTIGVVLATDGGSGDVLVSGADRVIFTVVAALAGYVALEVAAELVRRSSHNPATIGPPASAASPPGR